MIADRFNCPLQPFHFCIEDREENGDERAKFQTLDMSTNLAAIGPVDRVVSANPGTIISYLFLDVIIAWCEKGAFESARVELLPFSFF